jgi:hypothetical protein
MLYKRAAAINLFIGSIWSLGVIWMALALASISTLADARTVVESVFLYYMWPFVLLAGSIRAVRMNMDLLTVVLNVAGSIALIAIACGQMYDALHPEPNVIEPGILFYSIFPAVAAISTCATICLAVWIFRNKNLEGAAC